MLYVLEKGVYDERWIAGVFSTPEAAMAQAKGNWTHSPAPYECWDNDLDWSDAASVYAFEVDAP